MSKSELRRKCVVNPLDMADRLHELEQENEKLKADVAMLRDKARHALASHYVLPKNLSPDTSVQKLEYRLEMRDRAVKELHDAVNQTASSDAWLKEQKAKVMEEAAQWFDAQEYVAMSDDMSSIEDYAETQLRRMAAELRRI